MYVLGKDALPVAVSRLVLELLLPLTMGPVEVLCVVVISNVLVEDDALSEANPVPNAEDSVRLDKFEAVGLEMDRVGADSVTTAVESVLVLLNEDEVVTSPELVVLLGTDELEVTVALVSDELVNTVSSKDDDSVVDWGSLVLTWDI
jgi:hypothetical protein